MSNLKCTFLCFFLFFAQLCLGQGTDLGSQVVTLINEARTNPTGFLEKYKAKIEAYNPKYAAKLKTAKPINKIILDEGLREMAKSAVEKGDLNPVYAGKNKLCGQSQGQREGSISKDPLEYVCEFYTNTHDKNYCYFGIYFNKANTKCCYYWGASCETEKIQYKFTEKIDLKSVDFNKINTGKNAAYLSEVEKKMLLEVNFVRAYPKIYAKLVAEYLSNESASWGGLEQDTYDAGMELIAELNSKQPVSILYPTECLYTAAKLHGIDCQKRGFFSHTGSDKSDPPDRILKQCPKCKSGNENGAGNSAEDPRIPNISLLIDSGISSRGHRYNMLDPQWESCACYRYTDAKYGFGWVQNFSSTK